MAVMDIIIRATDLASKVIDDIGASGERLEKKFKSASDRMDTISRSFMTAGRGLTIGLTAPVMGLVGGLVKTGVEFKAFKQEAQQAFGVLLQSEEAAISHMDKILAFARTTPFAFPDLVTANRNLVSFGMTAKETFPVMEAIANSVAAMGGGGAEIGQMSDIFARITAQGKITSMELQRLGAQGINAVAILANQAGVSVDEMRAKISAGAIDSRTAINWLVDGMMHGTKGVAGATVAMGGSLGALKNTFKGAMDTLKGAWRTAADTIVSEDIFAKVVEGVHRLTGVIRGLPDLLGPLTSSIGGMLIGLVDKIASAVDWFFSLSPATQQAAVRFFAFAVALGPILIGLSKIISAGSLVIKATKSMMGVFSTAVSVVTYAARGMQLFVAAVKSGVLVQNIAAIATKAWTVAQAALNAVMALNPIALVVIAIAALIAAIVLLVKHWDWVKEKVLGAYHVFQEWFSNLPGWAKVLLSIIAPITLVVANIEKIADTAKKVWGAVSGFFGWGRKSVVEEVTALGGEAVGEVVKMSQSMENRLLQLQVTGGQITEEFANEVIENSNRMKEMAIKNIEEQYAETVKNLEYLRDKSGIITEEQYKAMMEVEEKRKDAAIQNQEDLNQAVVDKIRKLQESGVEVTAEMRAEIEAEIFAQRDAVIEAMAEQGAEVGLILSKLRHESGEITKEMASEAIKNSMEQRDQSIANAEQQYEDTIKAINTMSDEAIAATGKTRDELIEAAKEQRDGTIKAAEEMHEEAVKEVMAMGSDLEGEIDTTTGKILTGWEKFKIRFVQGASDAFWGAVGWFGRLPGTVWGFLTETWEKAVTWGSDMGSAALKAGKKTWDGFVDYIKGLPGRLWEILLETANQLLSIGGTLWKNAKQAAANLWEGFKKGIGKSSPSYLERAIDEIAERSRKLPGEMARDFNKLSGLRLPGWNGIEMGRDGGRDSVGRDDKKGTVIHHHYYYVGDVLIEASEISELQDVLEFFDKLRLRVRLQGGAEPAII